MTEERCFSFGAVGYPVFAVFGIVLDLAEKRFFIRLLDVFGVFVRFTKHLYIDMDAGRFGLKVCISL